MSYNEQTGSDSLEGAASWLGAYLANHGEAGYLWLDPDGLIRDYNEQAATLLAMEPADLTGRALRELVVGHDRRQFDLAIRHARAVPVSVALVDADGDTTIRGWLQPIHATTGFLMRINAVTSGTVQAERHHHLAADILKSIQANADRRSALQHLIELLNETRESRQVFEIAIDSIGYQIPGSQTIIFTRDKESGLLESVAGSTDTPEMSAALNTQARYIAEQALSRRQQRYIPSLDEGKTSAKYAMLATPVLDAMPDEEHGSDESICLGVITTTRPGSDSLSEPERQFHKLAADVIATALRNTWLYESRLQQTHDLAEVQRIGTLIATSLDIGQTVHQVVHSVLDIFEYAEHAAVRIAEGENLRLLGAAGPNADELPEIIAIKSHLLWQSASDGELLAIRDIHQLEPARHQRHPRVRGALVAPLIGNDGAAFGLLTVHSSKPRSWSDRERSLLMTMANTVAIAISNAREFERTRSTLRALVESLAAAIDAKDPNTHNHSRNVAHYARQIALGMGLPEDDVTYIELAGLLHDIGKIGIPDRVLLKQLSLTDDERKTMEDHPVIGERILGGHPSLDPILPLVRSHHERWDGTGYPDRLSGHRIPTGAAIIGLAEAFDTMITDRPYRARRNVDDALAEVRNHRGCQFSPLVVDHFLDGIESGKISVPSAPLFEVDPAATGAGIMTELSQDARATLLFHSIAAEVREVDDLNTFLANIARTIRDVLGKPFVQIFAANQATGELVHLVTLMRDQLLPPPRRARKINEGVTGWVVRHGRILNVPDVDSDPRFHPPNMPGIRVRSELAVPLVSEDRVIGVINIESEEDGAFTSVDEQLMVATANLLAQVIDTARVIDRIRQIATTDGLTGVPNHRTFYERLEDETNQPTEGGAPPLAIAIFDVDNLKQINDTYGHLAGDAALRTIAQTLQNTCRWTDLVCRYGGDEFALIMPATDRQMAWYVLDRVDRELSNATFWTGNVELPLPRGSWGVAIYPDDGNRPAELVNVADRQMYRNKHRRSSR